MKAHRLQYYASNMDRLSRRDRVFLNNPVIMQGLGLAPIVLPATNIQNALIIGVAVALLLTPTRMIAGLLTRRMGYVFRAITYVLTAGVLYVGVAWLLDIWFGQAVNSVGIFLSLLVMEPLITKRYESAQRERLFTSLKKGVITTLGFLLVLFLVAGIRELLAAGTFAGVEVFRAGLLPMMSEPAGGFLLVGLLAALWRSIVFNFKKRISLGVKELQ